MQVQNSITLIGNLGQDPEQVTTRNNSPMVRFSLATNEYWRDKDGNRQSRTQWHKIVCFGPRAEAISRFARKGSKMAITGTLRYNQWVDRNENKRTDANIQVNDFALLDPKSEGSAKA